MTNALRKTYNALRTNKHHALLSLILILFTLLTLLNSALLPLGEAPDETDHYQYHRFVARTGHPPLSEAERKEAGFKGGLAPLYYWLTAWPVALVGEETRPDIRRVDGRTERFIPTDGLGINRLVHTWDEQWPWRGQPLAWHLVRLLSLPLGWLTILATYALARRLRPGQPIIALGAAAFVAFLPRFVISSAVINDDNLVFALTAWLLLTQVLILQGDHRPRRFALFGLLFGLALLTKYFSLILIPEVIFTLFMATRRSSSRTTHYALRTTILPFLLAFLLTAGPWFLFIAFRFNRIDSLGLIPGLAASLGEPQITEGLVGLLSGQVVRPPAATYPLAAWFGLLYRSFWFEYGWMQIFAPTWVYGLFTIFLGAALLGLIGKSVVYARRWLTFSNSTNTNRTERVESAFWRPSLLLGLHLALFLFVVLTRYVLSATIDTGQGRHLFPALPVIALAISMGIHSLWTFLNFRYNQKGSPPPYVLWFRPASLRIFLLLSTCFLLPALISLLPGRFILPHYPILPVTTTLPAELPITYRSDVPVTKSFTFAGLAVDSQARAGSVLPVTLYWQAIDEVNQDYLVSLCLKNEQQQAVACLRSHFANGHYPARAWEVGDTLADTMFIPIPTCYRLLDQPYHLAIELWPLRPDSLNPQVEAEPVWQQTWAEPLITLRPTDSLLSNQPQTLDFWVANQRLTESISLHLNETVSQLNYAGEASSTTTLIGRYTAQRWSPLEAFVTPLHLPCDEGINPFATLTSFIAAAALPPDIYQPSLDMPGEISLSLNNRLRSFAPLSATLSFSDTLSPLSVELPIINYQLLISNLHAKRPIPTRSVQLPITSLPVTIRWQARRWMAEPLVISLKLLDKDFVLSGERIATLGDRYPNVLWAPTEIVEETYPLQIKPESPPGLYQLELSLIRQDKTLPDGFAYLPLRQDGSMIGPNLYPFTIRLLDPAHNSPPSHPFSARLGEAIRLEGFDLEAGNPLNLALFWQATATLPTDYTVFTQLLGPDGQVWAQWDNPPQAGRYPTSAWTTADRVIDRYRLSLEEGAPAGQYRLLVGMYDPASGNRLPAFIGEQAQPDNAIELTTVSLTP